MICYSAHVIHHNTQYCGWRQWKSKRWRTDKQSSVWRKGREKKECMLQHWERRHCRKQGWYDTRHQIFSHKIHQPIVTTVFQKQNCHSTRTVYRVCMPAFKWDKLTPINRYMSHLIIQDKYWAVLQSKVNCAA